MAERGACWGGGRDLHRRGGAGAWVPESRGSDGAEVCAEPVRAGWKPDVPNGGPWEMAGGREHRVHRSDGRPGEGERVPDRAGRGGECAERAAWGEGSGG